MAPDTTAQIPSALRGRSPAWSGSTPGRCSAPRDRAIGHRRVAAHLQSGGAGRRHRRRRVGLSAAHRHRRRVARRRPAQTGFTPNQYLTAYGFAPLQSAGLDGQGERVALIEIDGFRYSDITRLRQVLRAARRPAINGYGVGLKKPLAPGGESTLDLEVLDAAAPGLKAIDVYESQRRRRRRAARADRAARQPGSKPEVISASLGTCEPRDRAGDRHLRAAHRRGLARAGRGQRDLGARLQRRRRLVGLPRPQRQAARPAWRSAIPASSPWVTGVGGTNVALNAANRSPPRSCGTTHRLVVAAGGGGISDLFTRPVLPEGVRRRPTAGRCPTSRCSPTSPPATRSTAPPARLHQRRQHQPVEPGRRHERRHAAAGRRPGARRPGAAPTAARTSGLANPLLYKIARLARGGQRVLRRRSATTTISVDSIAGKPLGCCTAGGRLRRCLGSGQRQPRRPGRSSAGTLVPKIVHVGLSLPTPAPAVSAEHLLARCRAPGGA